MESGVFGLIGVYVWIFVEWEYREDCVYVIIFNWLMGDVSVLGWELKYVVVIKDFV